MIALKTALFTVIAPGTATVLLPWLILRHSGGASLTDSLAATAVGLGAIAFGAALYLWCATNFVRRGRGTPAPIDPPKHLVVAGPYRFTRNPMYVAVVSVVLGESLLFASWRLALLAALLLAGFHTFVVAYEEPTLTRLFGDEYLDYRRSVPRWLGVPGGPRRQEKAGDT
ncbi:MAG: isoprenylcysteine carboxylmethyltransferase family protein [Deltaproteobacteria bacterium]|nr:MAG: isoprenylcysteine carboxylmethyltransferase family protein [Deltaproteobacteria bacterium]